MRIQQASEFDRRIRQFFLEEGIVPVSESERMEVMNLLPTLPPLDEYMCLEPWGSPYIPLEHIKAYYEQFAQWEDLAAKDYFELEVEILNHLAQAIEQHGATVVADAGCGTGIQLMCLARLFPRMRFLGYDLSARSIQRAHERMQRYGLKNVSLYVSEHAQASSSVGLSQANFLYAKCALDSGPMYVPDFSYTHNPELAHQEFMQRSQMIHRWRQALTGFAEMMHMAGQALCIVVNAAAFVDALAEVGNEAGLRVERHSIHSFTVNPGNENQSIDCICMQKVSGGP